jgi:uncharacterized Rmd1/YagE family protein
LLLVAGGRKLNAMHPIAKSGKTAFRARALLVGERIDLRALGNLDRLAADPVTIAAGAGGMAVLFRYGAVVLFDVAPLEEGDLLRQLSPLVYQPYPVQEIESVDIRIDPNVREGMESNALVLADYALERFQLVADVLSKSTVLAMYESRVTGTFDLIEPFAADLARNAGSRRTAGELLRQIGVTMLSEHNLVGRVEVVDKPELIWEHPDLERFYLRLEDEFEIRERHVAVERKLDLLSRTAHTVLEVLQSRRSRRLEWYVIVLIFIEILLSVFQIFHGGG